MKAYNEETDTMLCESVLSKEEYFRKKTMGADIASANYQQEPIDLKGRLYQKFSTYETRSNYIKIWNYTDTADTGADNLCSIVLVRQKIIKQKYWMFYLQKNQWKNGNSTR